MLIILPLVDKSREIPLRSAYTERLRCPQSRQLVRVIKNRPDKLQKTHRRHLHRCQGACIRTDMSCLSLAHASDHRESDVPGGGARTHARLSPASDFAQPQCRVMKGKLWQITRFRAEEGESKDPRLSHILHTVNASPGNPLNDEPRHW